MKIFTWSNEKNEYLKRIRGISFEEILYAIEHDQLITIGENTRNYPNQRVFFVNIDDYVWLAPFVETGDEIFLKTAFSSRKATKEFLPG